MSELRLPELNHGSSCRDGSREIRTGGTRRTARQ
jgi:hypothetical protein